VAQTSDFETVKDMAVTKQLPLEQREGVARAMAPAIEQLVEAGKYEPPFTAQLTVTLTDKNGRTWTASVSAGELTSVLESANATRD
jgi:hypothetical protein